MALLQNDHIVTGGDRNANGCRRELNSPTQYQQGCLARVFVFGKLAAGRKRQYCCLSTCPLPPCTVPPGR